MDKITVEICKAMRPIFEEWDKQARLTQAEADILWYRHFEHKSVIEVARLTSYTEQGVVSVYSRAIKKVNQAIK